jgi:hypothetical protein
MKATLKDNERVVIKMSKCDAKILEGFLCCINKSQIERIAKEHSDEKLNIRDIDELLEELWDALDSALGCVD